MSGKIETILTRYEEDINNHDCQEWERHLSQDPSLKIINDISERKTRRKMELLDVDLVQGSAFPKSKTRHDFKSSFLFSVMSVIFFPLRSSWWIRKTSIQCYFVGCIIFFSFLMNLYWYQYFLCSEGLDSCDKITIHEIYEPIILFIVLAFLQSQIVSPLKYKNLDFFEQHPVISTSSGGEPKNIPQRKTSAAEQRRISVSRKNSTKTGATTSSRKTTPVRKLSRRSSSLQPCQLMDSLHENSSSGSENEDQPPTRLSDQARVSCHHTSQSSDDQESETEDAQEVGSSRKQSKQNSDELSSSGEERNNKQSSPIILQIGTTQWNDAEAPSKVYMSALQIGNKIFDRSQEVPDGSGYAVFGILCAVIIALLPLTFKIGEIQDLTIKLFTKTDFNTLTHFLMNPLNSSVSHTKCSKEENDIETIIYTVIILTSAVNRLILTVTFFVLLSVAERAFKRRFLTAKLFSHITSTRKSMKSRIPHFRLNKVRNIKAWLCVRAYLRKRGPQRSIDCIVSTAFMLTLIMVSWLCYQLLHEEENNPEINVTNCQVIFWCVASGIFLLRYMTLASKLNKKYRNLSVLLTEQINVYLKMELKPHKKEQLQLANNVLKLATDLLKELETPLAFKIHGLSANPFLYNVTKVLVLSAVSGVLSEMLGFKLKLYKVKIK